MDQVPAPSMLIRIEVIITSLVLILVVAAMGGKIPDNRRMAYDTTPEDGGPYPYFSRVLFDDNSPLDAAILGSSLEMVGINPSIIQDELLRLTGERHKIALLASNWRGEDLLYFLARDLLANRRVGILIIGVPHYGSTRSVPHPLASYWWPLQDVSWNSDAAVIALATVGIPRRVLLKALPPVRVRPRLGPEFDGGIDVGAGFKGKPFEKIEGLSIAPRLPASATFHLTRSTELDRSVVPLNEFQLTYLRRIAELAEAHGTKVALLQVPIYSGRLSQTIETRSNILDVVKEQTPYLGIVPARLWNSRPRGSEVEQYYYDDHLNLNGRTYFSYELVSAFKTLLSAGPAEK
jgi:hypothetical protein